MNKNVDNEHSHTIRTPRIYSRTIGDSSFWMASWRIGGKVQNVHLGAMTSMTVKGAEAKALKLKTEAIELFDKQYNKGLSDLKKRNPPNLDRLCDTADPRDIAFFGTLEWREQKDLLQEVHDEIELPAHDSEGFDGEIIHNKEEIIPAVTFSDAINKHREDYIKEQRKAELDRFWRSDPTAHGSCSIGDIFWCKKCRINFISYTFIGKLKYCPLCGSDKHIFKGDDFIEGKIRLKLKPEFA